MAQEREKGKLMRLTGLAVLCLVALLLSALGTYSYGEPAEQRDISFAFPYGCSKGENGNCLADSFEAGLNVVLVSKKVNCSAKTADRFMHEHAGNEFEATRLIRTENCLIEKIAQDDKGFIIAVIGADPSAVRVVEAKNDKSLLPKDMELKARKIASLGYKRLKGSQFVRWDVAESPPDVFGVGDTAFLLFQCTDGFLNQDGLPVLVLKKNAFLLKGACAFRSPFFFSIKEKLHVAYWATVSCCGCGDSNFFVYDLSGESPMQVYQSSAFSD